MSASYTLDGEPMFPSLYIGAVDLNGKDKTVQISDVHAGDLYCKGKTVRKAVLSFHGEKKKLPVNKTNFATIAELYNTTECREWIGKWITLYPTIVNVGPKKKPGVRIRDSVPKQSQQQQAKPVTDAENIKASEAALSEMTAAIGKATDLESLDSLGRHIQTELTPVLMPADADELRRVYGKRKQELKGGN